MSEAKVVLSGQDKSGGAWSSFIANAQRAEGALNRTAGAAALWQRAAGALAIGAAAGVFAARAKEAIDYADDLNKLSQRLGMSTEDLSQWVYVAKLANVSQDVFAKGVRELNKSIAQGLAGDKEKIASFKALGITQADLAKGTEAVMLKIADAYSTAADGAGKGENAFKLMGKAGDEMIPALNGGSAAILKLKDEAKRLGLTISTEFAQQAEEFNDNMTRLKSSSDQLYISLAGDLVRGLGDATRAMSDATVAGGKLAGVAAFVQTFLTGTDQYKADKALVDLTERKLSLEASISKLAAQQGRGSGNAAAVEHRTAELARVNAELKTTLNYRNLLAEQAAKTKAAADAAQNGRTNGKPIRSTAGGGEAEAAFNRELDAQVEAIKGRDRIVQELAKQSADTRASEFKRGAMSELAYIEQTAQAEIDAMGSTRLALLDQLAVVQQKSKSEKEASALRVQIDEIDARLQTRGIQYANEYVTATGKRAQATYLANAALQEQWDLEVELEKAAADQRYASVVASVTAYAQEVKDANEQLDAELVMMGKSQRARDIEIEQRRIMIRLRDEERKIDQELRFDPDRAAMEKARARAAAVSAMSKVETKVYLDEWQKTADSINDSLTDALLRGFESGKDFAENFRDTLKNMFQTLVLRPMIQGIMQPISGGVASMTQSMTGGGLMGAANNASALSTIGGAGLQFLTGSSVGASTASLTAANAVGAFGGDALGTLIAGNGGWAGVAAGAEVAGAAAGTAAGTAAGGAAATGALAAIPVVGWVALAAIALYSIFGNKGGGPKQEGVFGTTFSGIGSRDNSFAPGLEPIGTGMQAQYDALAKQFGGAAAITFGLALSRDPQGKSPTFVEVAGSKDGQQVFSHIDHNVGRSDEDATKALQAAVVDGLIEGLKETELSARFTEFFDTIAREASPEVKQAAITLAGNAAQVFAAFKQLGSGFAEVSEMAITTAGKLIDASGGMQALSASMASYYGHFYSEKERLDILSGQVQERMHELGYAGVRAIGEFRHIVEALDLNTEAGAEMFASLMQVEAAFYEVAMAGDAAAKAAQKVQDDLKAAVDELGSNVDSARSALLEAYNREATALRQSIDQHKAYAAQLRQERDLLFLGDTSPLAMAGKTDEARRQFDETYAKAQAGDLEAIARLQSAGNNYLAALKDSAITPVEFSAGFSRVTAALAIAAAQQDAAATIEEQQLEALNKQLDALGLLNQNLMSFSQALVAYSAALATQAAGARGVLAAAGGTAGATEQWVTTPYGETYTSSGGAVGLAVPGGIQIYGLESQMDAGTLIGEFNEAIAAGDELSVYNTAVAEGISSTSLDALMEWEPGTSAQWASDTGHPAFRLGGLASRGGAIVGEEGEEYVDFETPGRVYTAEQTAGMFAGGRDPAVAALLRDVLAEIKSLRQDDRVASVAMTAQLFNVADMLKKFDEDGLPPEREPYTVPA